MKLKNILLTSLIAGMTGLGMIGYSNIAEDNTKVPKSIINEYHGSYSLNGYEDKYSTNLIKDINKYHDSNFVIEEVNKHKTLFFHCDNPSVIMIGYDRNMDGWEDWLYYYKVKGRYKGVSKMNLVQIQVDKNKDHIFDTNEFIWNESNDYQKSSNFIENEVKDDVNRYKELYMNENYNPITIMEFYVDVKEYGYKDLQYYYAATKVKCKKKSLAKKKAVVMAELELIAIQADKKFVWRTAKTNYIAPKEEDQEIEL